jgi:Effector-associated domain 7
LLCSYLNADATSDDVDAGVDRMRRDEDKHLRPMLKRITGDRSLYDYVRRIYAGEHIKFYPAENRQQAKLELLGVVKADVGGFCVIRNRIYKQMLDSLVISRTIEVVAGRVNYDQAELRTRLEQYFSVEELRTICFDMSMEYDNLPGEGKAGKCRELILELDRKGRISELNDELKKQRPKMTWNDVLP